MTNYCPQVESQDCKMVNERKCETVQEEECSMVSLKIFLKTFSFNGEFDNKF